MRVFLLTLLSIWYNTYMDTHFKTIYLGGGCFWCTEAVFQELRGIKEVIPGYMGGILPEPSYEAVSTGTSGHVEVTKLYYDEQIISTEDILDIFFATHDPTVHDRQGADIGSQYRSVIFYTEEAQREIVRHVMDRLQKEKDIQIVTEVQSATPFYPAEEYHHNYYRAHTNAPYCLVVISPKIEKLKKEYKDKIQ